MRWLISLAFVGLATLVLSEIPNAAIHRALVRPGPLIKLAVQPAIASEPLVLAETETDEVAPVAAAEPILPYAWPGYGGPRSWYGWNRPAPSPFWGGYRPRNWASLGGPYWRPRLAKPTKVATDATIVDEPKVDTDAAVSVAVDDGLDTGLDAGLSAAVVSDIA